MTPIDINPADLETVRQILREKVPELEVRVFGSRASWTARETSDLDLVLMTKEPLDISCMTELKESFSESNLPFRVDVVDWADTSEKFREIIESKSVTLPSSDKTCESTLKVNTERENTVSKWKEVSIGEIAEVIGGGTPSTKDMKNFNGEIPWLTPKDLAGFHDRYISRGARNLSQKGLDSCSAKLLPRGTVLLSTRAPIGYVAIAKNPIATNQGFHSLIPQDGFIPEYIYYWMTANTKVLENHACGTTFTELSGSNLKQIHLWIPSVTIQESIAQILGTLDDKIELNRRTSETLEAITRTLFNSWFVDFDPVRAKTEGRWRRGESFPSLPAHLYDFFPDRLVDSELGQIPDGWNVKKLNDVANMTRGRSYRSADLTDSNVALVTLKSFNRGGGYRSEGLKPYTGPYKPEQVVEPSEVIISCTDVTQNAEVIGKPAMVRPNSRYSRFVASLDIMIVRPKNHYISKEFLYLLASTPAFTNHTYSHSTGTTVLHLDKDAIPSFKFALPPSDVTLVFGEIAKNIFSRVFCLEEETNTLTELRNTLLPKLISGELSVNDMKNLNTAF